MSAEEPLSVISFANPALDRSIGGIPIPSLTLIEGTNDSGKSVLSQQTAFGALKTGLKVRYLTTENTFTSLVSQMDSLSYTVNSEVQRGQFKVTELHTQGTPWSPEVATIYLTVMSRFLEEDRRSKLEIIDSLTSVVSQASSDEILRFFSELRDFVDKDRRCVIVTLHPYAFDPALLIRIRSMCDGHLVLSIKEMRGKVVRSLEVAKMRGATMRSSGLMTFDVDPAFGIRITPLTSAKG